MDTRELRVKRAKVIADMRALHEKAEKESRDLSAEEAAQYEKMKGEEKSLRERIQREEDLSSQQEELRASQHEPIRPDPANPAQAPAPTDEQRSLALQGWLRIGSKIEPEKRHVEAAKACGMNLGAKEIELALHRDYRVSRKEFRDMSLTVGAGGYAVPTGFVPNFELALLAFSNIRDVAEVIRTTMGNDLHWPTANDTSNKGEIVGEAGSIGASVDPAVSELVIKAYKYSSKLVKVSSELLEDSAFNLAAQVGAWLGERIGRIQADHFAIGSGVSQPKGIVTAATLGITAASATAITGDEVLKLIRKVDAAYRTGARFMMHDDIMLQVELLKDGNGQYLLQPGLQNAAGDRIRGYPVSINMSMASTLQASAKVVIFGQLSKYKIRDVNSIRLLRLNELYAANDQVGFVAFLRSDGNLLDAGTNPVKYLQTHA